jgi:queuine tRNA-ribosyltransferase
VALAPLPDDRFRMNVRSPDLAADEAPLVEGCPCPACARHTRAYLHYLTRAEELTAVRLLTLHNLTYLERLVRGAREAIAAGRYEEYRSAGLAGAAPWSA